MRTILLYLMLVTTALGQGSVTTQTKTVVEAQTIKLGNYLVVPSTFKAEPFNLGYIQIDTNIPYNKLEEISITSIVNGKTLPVPFMELNITTPPYELLVTQVGLLHIEVFGIDFDNKLFIHRKVDYELIPLVPPIPPVPPAPSVPVPVDVFDNIGQRVAEWTKGLPNTKLIGDVYLQAAIDIKKPSETVTTAAAALRAKLVSMPEYSTNFVTFSKNINADLNLRWTATSSKGVLSDYWKCVALGLGSK